MRTCSLYLLASALLVACPSTKNVSDGGGRDGGPGDAGSGDAGPGDGGGSDASTGLEAVPLQTTLTAPGLSFPVDVVRDTYGNPHIYGNSLPDISYAQGYMVAHDRLIQLDFERHSADGTLSYLIGGASPPVVAQDVQMRIHHLRDQAQATYSALEASTDPTDQLLKAALDSFANGVNAYWSDLNAGVYSLPLDYATVYQPASFEPWTSVDSILLGELLTFQLAFDASDDIMNSALLSEGASLFDNSTNPALAARAGIGEDLQVIAPADPTTTISGWTGFNGDTSTALRERLRQLRRHTHGKGTAPFAPPRRLVEDDLRALATLRTEARGHLRGSNNWIVGPQLSATGNVMVANDTHLSIDSPATFWIQHLVNHGSDQPLNVMGEQLPGVPLVTIGMNRHIVWGATTNYIDVTDVYQETIVPCPNDAGPCAQFNGQLVPLVPTVQTFQVGYIGVVGSTLTFTTYSVPEHGPIIPRVLTDSSGAVTGLDALRPQELSVRYTGYTAAPLLKAIFGLDTAGSFQDAKTSLDQYFGYGGQNWVIGDDQGNWGWTETIRVPIRPVSTTNLPWQILPGDGTAEWGAAWMDPHYIPHAENPAKGFLATSNNDPIGTTLNDSPFVGQPQAADGGQLYLGSYYDPGMRVGRSTKRLSAFADAGQKLTLDDMQSIQADAITQWGQGFAPTLLDSANALLAEAAALSDGGVSTDGGADGGIGPHPELASMLLAAENAADGGFSVPLLQQAHDLVAGWTFDTPSGAAEDNPTPQQVSDSKATLLTAYWISHFTHDTLDDELALFDPKQIGIGESVEEKLMLFLVQSPLPAFIKTGTSKATGDSILFDNLNTPDVVESKQMIGAQALIEAIQGITGRLGTDPANWAWGDVHTITLHFFLGAGIADTLNVPPPADPKYPNGYPRHGDNGTVDVGPHGLDVTNFAYEDLGPAIRFVAEVDPVNGPTGRNALPGGEIFDPASPHFSDQMQLWRKNQTFDFAYQDAAVIAAAMQEYQTNGIGRVRFQP
jgi:penicillin amidase